MSGIRNLMLKFKKKEPLLTNIETYIECYDENLGFCKSLSNATSGTKSKGQERKGM